MELPLCSPMTYLLEKHWQQQGAGVCDRREEPEPHFSLEQAGMALQEWDLASEQEVEDYRFEQVGYSSVLAADCKPVRVVGYRE